MQSYSMFLFHLSFYSHIAFKSFHVVSYSSILFLFTAEKYSIVPMYHYLFIHLLVGGYLGSFCYKNKAVMNIHVQVFVWTCFHFYWLNTLD